MPEAATRRKAARGHPRAVPERERFRVNLRDRLCCRGCGCRARSRERFHRGFEYHHAVPVREGGRGAAENVVLLCKPCHRRADRGELPLDPAAFTVPGSFPCRACGAILDPCSVEAGRGWYACPVCGERTHLYDHFYRLEP